MPTQRLFQPSFAGGELSPALYARIDLGKYAVGLRKCRNFTIHRSGGVSNRAGFAFLGAVAEETVAPTLIPFRFNNTSQVCLLEFGEKNMRIWYQGGLIEDSAGAVVRITTPYTAAEAAQLSHAQSGDVLYLAHPDHPPAKLERTAWTAWIFTVLTFSPAYAAPTGAAVSRSGDLHTYSETVTYKISAIRQSSGEESLASAAFSATGPTADDWPVGTKMVLTWNARSDVAYYRVYKAVNGLYGYIGLAGTNRFEDSNVNPDISDGPPEATNPFAATGSYPAVVAIHQQRLCFAATTNKPHGLWMSRTGFFENFSKSQVAKSDDAIAVLLGSGEINAIRGLLSVQDLIILTSGSENVCNGGSTGSAISATANGIAVRPQSYWGAGSLPPLLSGNTCLYVQGLGAAVRDLFYDYSVDGFVGTDRSILARHLLDGHQIVSWAYAQVPDSTFWLVREDGVLLSLTYFREQDVGAWALHTTSGAFERVAVIEGDDRHELYAVVRRTINGKTRRFVERMASRRIETIADAAFLDAHLVYDGAATATLTGLDHLAGASVGLFADGNVLDDLTVSATGTITLPRPATHVVVGLRYDQQTWIETLDLDLGQVQGLGTVQGRRLSVPKVMARIEASREFRAGPDLGHLTLTKVALGSYDSPPELITGDVEITLAPTWTGRGRIVVQPNGPVPLTLLALSPDLVVGG